MNCAKSPTTLEEGVTLMISPSSLLASAYACLIEVHSLDSPKLCIVSQHKHQVLTEAWNIKLVYCPPGISCMYTSAAIV